MNNPLLSPGIIFCIGLITGYLLCAIIYGIAIWIQKVNKHINKR